MIARDFEANRLAGNGAAAPLGAQPGYRAGDARSAGCILSSCRRVSR